MKSAWRHPVWGLHRFHEEAEAVGGVVIRSGTIAVGPEGVDAGDNSVPGGLHLGSGLLNRPNGVRNVLEAFASLGEPISVDARAFEWFDQLVLRRAVVEG